MTLSHLDALTTLLRGKLPPRVDWMATLALANQSLVTPQVYAAARAGGVLHRLPQDVETFLGEAWRRNRARNRRLFAQLGEAVAALNSAGVAPLLFKGAGHWASLGRPADHDRMLNDLDLIVAPHEAPAALRALEGAGFRRLKRFPQDSHWVAELGRPQDVGLIDLHRRPPGPPELAVRAMAIPGQTLPIAWGGLRASAPSPALQIFLMTLHDQFQDGGYWRGEFPLRHLLEIAELSGRPEGVDWSVLARLASTRLARNALDAQLLAAGRLFGARTPPSARRLWIRLQHARRRAQFGWPDLSPALRLLAA